MRTVRGPSAHPGRFAAIDIGTVTVRLLVADVTADGALTPVAKRYRICNLGEGVDQHGVLSEAAIRRVLDAIDEYRAVVGECTSAEAPLAGLMAVATSATRDAKNSHELLDALAERGIELQVISGNEEARLTFAGATSSWPGTGCMVLDVGGGSTEVSFGIAGEGPRISHSFDLGSRRCTERYLLSDPPTAGELKECSDAVAAALEAWAEQVPWHEVPVERMIAVAGAATSIVSMLEGMVEYDSDRVHGTTVGEAELAVLIDRLAAMTLVERQQVVGLDPGRAPVIIAGLLIILQVMHVFDQPALTASENDILQGIILHLSGK